MRIYNNIDEFKPVKNAVVTIGTFDGVHLGHRKIISRIKEIAEEKRISRTRLHHDSEVAYTTIRTVFRNPYDDGITLHTLARLAEALGVPTAALIEDENGEGE